MLEINQQITIQKMQSDLFNGIDVHVLRLDELHPIVSGNKWFKLRYYLKDAIDKNKKTVATFGGAFSNHIVATAFAAKAFGLKSLGIIRGEKPQKLSHTLKNAQSFGMELYFVGRTDFNNKEQLKHNLDNNYYWISEGGFGQLGMQGAMEILHSYNQPEFTHIVCSCGTGTMLAGLVNAAMLNQKVIGICALKGYEDLAQDVLQIMPNNKNNFSIFHEYHFGGYAKHPQQLIDWMNLLWQEEKLPTDIVYTSKLMYAVHDLCTKNYCSSSDKLLIIHSGGLQGNLSLPNNTLSF